MSHRASDNSKVSLFPFLAVLLCTMGALLVLLVVLAQQASRRTKNGQLAEATAPTAVEQTAVHPAASVAPEPHAPSVSAKRMAKLRETQKRLKRFEQELLEKLKDEKARLQHVEEHSRRLEHDLAKLYIANEQLKNTKKDQDLDQEQAERELARLKQLIADSEEQLEELQAEAQQPKSFAILPYRGPNGTLRPPMHIECSQGQIVIQPTGIQLAEGDFEPPVRPSNALAAAIRATQEFYSKQAEQTGKELGEPYPLIIVRADGRDEYRAVLSALSAAGVEYGYEFVNADKRLKYPAADPVLAEAQNHAVLQARAWQEQLARSAPRRFASRQLRIARGGRSRSGSSNFSDKASSAQTGLGGAGSSGSDGNVARGRYGYGDENDGNAGGSAGEKAGGSGSSGSLSMAESGLQLGGDGVDSSLGERKPGEISAGQTGGGQAGGPGTSNAGGFAGDQSNPYSALGQTSGGASGEAGAPGGGENSVGSEASTATGSAQAQTQAGGASAGGSSADGSSAANSANSISASNASSAGGSASSDPSAQQNNPGSPSFTKTFSNSTEQASVAGARGADWALKKTRGQSVAMRRPIPVVVRPEGLTLLPNQDSAVTRRIAPKTIVFDQATDQLLDEFAAELRQHTAEWGLAGRGLHWRPVLLMKVAPNAVREANKFAKLLEGSGVDIEFSQTANRPKETNRATR